MRQENSGAILRISVPSGRRECQSALPRVMIVNKNLADLQTIEQLKAEGCLLQTFLQTFRDRQFRFDRPAAPNNWLSKQFVKLPKVLFNLHTGWKTSEIIKLRAFWKTKEIWKFKETDSGYLVKWVEQIFEVDA